MQTKPCIGIYIEKGRGAVPLFSNFEATVGQGLALDEFLGHKKIN